MKTLIKLAVIIIVMTLLFIKTYVPLMSEKCEEKILSTDNQNLKENSVSGIKKIVLK